MKKGIKIGFVIAVLLVVTFFMSGMKEVIPLDEINPLINADSQKELKIESEEKSDSEEKSESDNKKELESEAEENTQIPKSDKSKQEIIAEQKELKAKIIEEDLKNKDKKDKYLTDPVPEGKPTPVEWQEAEVDKEKELKATLSVTCKTILNNMHLFNMKKIEVLPEDGIIFPEQEVIFFEGESVFDVLLREVKDKKIHMEFTMTPMYNSNYIEGIHNLYEFDCGELSGWMYRVNGWFPNYGCSRYVLEEGDLVEWIYTADLGRDIGGEMAIGGE